MSAYIITTTREYEAGAGFESERAVATLDEARRAVRYAAQAGPFTDEEWAAMLQLIANLLEAGGTIGPLPDGTVIEVRPVEWPSLASRVDNGAYLPEQGVLDAFNAQA